MPLRHRSRISLYLSLFPLGTKQCNELDAMKAPLAKAGGRLWVCFSSFLLLFSLRTADWVNGDSGGGLKGWFSPRGQDVAFLWSCIGLVRPSSSVDLKQNKTKNDPVGRLVLQSVGGDSSMPGPIPVGGFR
jgi:hypothetical protein